MEGLTQVPCPLLVTDESGRILALNDELLQLVGGGEAQWLQQGMDQMLPPASRIFLQTHIWPLLYRQGSVREIHLQVRDAQGQRVPVMLNCRLGKMAGIQVYIWVLFVARERSRYEQELLTARAKAEASAEAIARSERFVKTVTDSMPGLVGYWDHELRCRFANAPYRMWFGKEPSEVIGTTMLELMGEHLFGLNQRYVQGALAGTAQQFERTLVKADGSVRQTLANYIPDRVSDGSVAGFFVLVTDVTALKEAESELLLAASVFRNTIEGIMVTDENGLIVSVNPAFTAITGYAADEAIGSTPRLLKSHRHEQRFFEEVWQQLRTAGHWEGETWNRRKNGEIFLVWQSITTIPAVAGGPLRYVSVFHDITERWRDDERLRHLALHDALTDLPNRALLIERLTLLIAITERELRAIAVMFIDLDGFKAVNDQHGHQVGDELLIAIGQRLSQQVRHSDTVARLGGDEFVVLLDNPASLLEVERIAERIVAAVAQPVVLSECSVRVSATLGIAVHPAGGQTAETLMAHADAAMYQAKRAGKGTYRFHHA